MVKKPRAQGILDFILTFIAILGLFVGIVRIWVWFHANYARRQVAFQSGRLFAGNVTTYEGRTSPVEIGQSPSCPSGDCYKPIDLTTDWVFRGQTGGELVGAFHPTAEINIEEVKEQCRVKWEAKCQQDYPDTALEECPDYAKCMCEEFNVKRITNYYQQVIDEYDQQIPKLQEAARSMRQTAEDCDDPWEICWWFGGFGYTGRQIKQAAGELDKAVFSMTIERSKLVYAKAKLEICCDKPTIPEQQLCISTSQHISCPDLTGAYVQLWQERKSLIEGEISNLQGLKDAVVAWIPSCNAKAESQDTANACALECTEDPSLRLGQYAACFSDCKERVRNECCQSFSYSGFAYASGMSCGDLDVFANTTLTNEIAKRNCKVGKLIQAINQVGGCCLAIGSDNQLNCIETVAGTAAQAYNDEPCY